CGVSVNLSVTDTPLSRASPLPQLTACGFEYEVGCGFACTENLLFCGICQLPPLTEYGSAVAVDVALALTSFSMTKSAVF
ncbi:hypothetical protein, partial [Pseudomonas sp. L1(2025)]|uniref:hypothetical protein n=1 Tax=Pseudomonas sp. L1(2025) TaxID=3449429 RepID=UPI003F68EF43